MSLVTNTGSRSGKLTPYEKLTSFFRKVDNQLEAEMLSEKKNARKNTRVREKDEDEMT